MKLVILDRDGVINHDSDDYIRSPSDWHPIEGSPEAVAQLCQAGFEVAVATNQSGLARGYFDQTALYEIHAKMTRCVERAGGHFAAICVCPHHPDEHCHCRKPATGLIDQIAQKLGLDPKGSPFVGDAISDIRAALSAGCQPVLVATGNGKYTEHHHHEELAGVPMYACLLDAVQEIINQPFS